MKIHSNLADKNSLLKLEALLAHYDTRGEMLSNGDRNTIKNFDFEGRKISIKSFKIPNLVNKVAYRFFRKSKAQRSFEYATALLAKNIGTPAPIAYAQQDNGLLFGASFYICNHLEYDLTYRDLVEHPRDGDIQILKAFTAFTYKLHENGINFLDHSPGNTLIVKKNDGFSFYLVDLNRMEFKSMDFDARMKNFSRLTPKKKMVITMAREYARLGNYDEETTINAMWKATTDFQTKFMRKKQLKKKLKFWKND